MCFEQKKSNWHTMCLLAGPPYFGVRTYVPYIASSRGTEGKHITRVPLSVLPALYSKYEILMMLSRFEASR